MMSPWHRSQRTALVVGAVALALLLGTGAVMAAQTHLGPFSTSSLPALANTQRTNQSGSGEDQHLVGTVQSVNAVGQTFVLTPDAGTTAVIIAFDAKTTIEKDRGETPLAVGAHVSVEVIQRPDGSLYAGDIQFVQQGQAEEEHLIGTIQSVNLSGQTFVLAPEDGSATVTITFDTQTILERTDGDNPLVAGVQVSADVIKRADGSLYAKEIQRLSDGHGDGDGNGGSDGGSGGGSSGGGSGDGDGGGSGSGH